MKFVKQKDCCKTFVNEHGEEVHTPEVMIEEPLLDYWLKVAGAEGRPELVVTDVEEVFFDPGGMIATDEPKISVEVRGQKFGSWLRSADELAEVLRRDCKWAHDPDGPPHCYVRERWCNVLLTPETAKEAADAIEEEFKNREDEADEAEYNVTVGKINAGVAGRLVDFEAGLLAGVRRGKP